MPKPKKYAEGVFEKNPGSDVWYIRYRSAGKLVRRKIGTHEQAKKAIKKVYGIRENGNGIIPTTAKLPVRTADEVAVLGTGITVAALCDAYQKHILDERNPERPTSPVNHLHHLKVIRRDLGSFPAHTLRPKEIRTWLKTLNVANATLNKFKSTISGVYSHAIEEEVVESNPCRDVKHFKTVLATPRWLREEEEDKLRAVIDRWVTNTPAHHKLTRLWLQEHHNELTVAIGTGFRKGNQYGLTWDMVDFKQRLILLPTTKPGVPHVVAMTDDVRDALLDQQRIQKEIATIDRRIEITAGTKRVARDRVFSITENREWFKAAVKEAKIPHLRWHDLRHTTASRLAIAGANQKVIQSVLGHATLAMSARYTHLSPDYLHEPMAALNRKKA